MSTPVDDDFDETLDQGDDELPEELENRAEDKDVPEDEVDQPDGTVHS